MTQDKLESKATKMDRRTGVEERRKERDQVPSKVVVRRLPPSLTAEMFIEQVSPVPPHDFFYFVKADHSLGQHAFTRAYINFTNPEDVFNFRDKFDGYVFVDSRGNEYPAIVEFAPFQKIPKKKMKKTDTKKGTIEQDIDYMKFLDNLENPDVEPSGTVEAYLEEIEQKEKEIKANHGALKTTTPLIDYLKRRREEKKMAAQLNLQKMREEKKRQLERRRLKEDSRRKKELEKQKTQKERLREKEKEREKEREREKEKEKEQEKERDKEKDPKKEDTSQVKQLLKNTERDKERDDKKMAPPKFKDDKSTGKEKLRFSKENREREKAERASRMEKTPPPDRFRPPRDTGYASDRPKPVRDDYHDRSERFAPKSRPVRDDRNQDRPRSGRDDYHDRPRSSRDPREYKTSYGKREVDHGSGRPEKDKGERPEARERERGKLEERGSGKGRQAAPSGGRDAGREVGRSASAENAAATDGEALSKREKPSVTSRVASPSSSLASPSASSSSRAGEPQGADVQSDSKSEEKDERRRRKKERPERQIYVPRKAREGWQEGRGGPGPRSSGSGTGERQSGGDKAPPPPEARDSESAKSSKESS